MKKILILAASTALVLAACGKKDEATAKAKVDEAKVEVTETAKDMAETKAEDSYGSDSKEMDHAEDKDSSYGSGTEGAAVSVLNEDDRAFMVKSCVDDGSATADCECAVDAMNGSLSAETANMFVKMGRLEEAGDAEGAMEMMSSITPAQQSELMAYLPKIGECNPEMLQKMMGG